MLAFSINDSAGTLMFYANRLMELPIGVFAIAVSTVIYPLLSRHAVERNFTALADDFLRGVRLILVINVPAAAGLALLSEPIVRVLFERHNFTAADTAAMAPLLALYVIGLPFFSVVSLTVRAFYSVKNTPGAGAGGDDRFRDQPCPQLGPHALAGRRGPCAREHDGDRGPDVAVAPRTQARPPRLGFRAARAEFGQDRGRHRRHEPRRVGRSARRRLAAACRQGPGLDARPWP